MRSLMRFWFYCLVAITPFVFTAINDELFEFNKMMFVYMVAVAVATTWAIWSVRARQVLWRNHFLLPFMAAFLLSQVLSTVFSIHPATSIIGYYSRFHGGLLSTVAYLTLMQAAASTLKPSDIRPLLRVALLSLVGVCLYAIPEHFGVSPSCILITHEANVSCWIQDVQNRVFASFGQPNWLAAYIITLLPFAAWFALNPESGGAMNGKPAWLAQLDRWLPWVALVLGTLTLIFTKSRSGAFGLMAAGAVFAVTLAWHGWNHSRGSQKSISFWPVSFKTTGLVLSAMLVPMLLFGFGSWSGLEGLSKNLSTTAPATPLPTPAGTQLESGGTDSGKIRLIVWEGALKIWQRYPVLGSGVETFAYAYYQDRPRSHNDISEWDFLYNKAHNEFLNFLATTGALGLITYSALIVVPAFFYWREASRKNSHVVPAAAWLASSTGLAVSNFFGFSTVMVGLLFFLLPGLWLVFSLAESDGLDIPGTDWEHLSWSQWIAVATISVLAIWGGMKVIQTWNNDSVLAISKAALSAGESEQAYRTAVQLTTQAPTEAVFWEQRALTMSRLAISLSLQDATVAAQLAVDADQSSQAMLQLNSRHLNLWKSRIRVLLFLSSVDERYLQQIPQTIQQAIQLAPTDAKLTHNLALVYDTLGDPNQAETWYHKTLELRPGYEEARFGYALFLRAQARLPESRDQYQYIFDHNPNALNALEAVEEIEATISAQMSQKPAQR